jgi:phospholipid/cholesterol/gamma-HCH transport system ATP-binding protein
LLVTYRYQDGNIVANFRYNPDNGRLDRVEKNDGRAASRTIFMVLREGRLIFEGPQNELEASQEPYVAKFVKRRE